VKLVSTAANLVPSEEEVIEYQVRPLAGVPVVSLVKTAEANAVELVSMNRAEITTERDAQ
jgi:hypothetical protein